MIIKKEGILDTKGDDVRGSKNIKILNVIFPDAKYPVPIIDWETVDEINDIRAFRSDGLKLKANYIFEYDESPSIDKITKKPNINPKSGKPYINRNFKNAYEPNSPLNESPKVQPPVKIQPKKEVREELRDEESSGEPIRHEELLNHIENLEDFLLEIELNDRLKRIEDIISKDYDENGGKLDAVIQTQTRIEEMIKLIAKKIGIEQSEEFKRASEI